MALRPRTYWSDKSASYRYIQDLNRLQVPFPQFEIGLFAIKNYLTFRIIFEECYL